jgi:hypothetical protein
MAMLTRTCRCGAVFEARAADVKRGWGKFCSKSCKASDQTRRQHRSGAPFFNDRDERGGFDGQSFRSVESDRWDKY